MRCLNRLVCAPWDVLISSLIARKRYPLAVLLIQSQLRKSTDDIAEIFVKTVRKLDGDAAKRLQEYRVKRALPFECLEVLQPQATYRDDAFALAITWMLHLICPVRLHRKYFELCLFNRLHE